MGWRCKRTDCTWTQASDNLSLAVLYHGDKGPGHEAVPDVATARTWARALGA